MSDPVAGLPRAWGGAAGTGSLRASAADFEVIEDLGLHPSGEGEHVLLKIRKRNLNTAEVAGHIARLAGVRPRDVSYAGLKDRVAVTTQTFSVHLPGKDDPDWTALEGDNLEVLQAHRHHRKLRRGALRGNHFHLRIHDFRGDAALLETRLEQITSAGVPNYFGSQRFGREGGNLAHARALFAGERKKVRRDKRSIWLSAARSWLFNLVLAERVRQGTWNQIIDGDVMQLAGASGQFRAENDEVLPGRLQRQEVHVTGPLCGCAGRALEPQGAALALEQSVLAEQQAWIDGLQRFGLEHDRRALGVRVRDLQWSLQGADLEVRFSLDSGSYATVVMGEILA
ncbi:tRNA pseudouridine(13) synthase TruD [Thiolapillus brandeum]|uniref:tRNA pseudouridine synthase D n=1 Tax=Thiolapillus brandeum TaxID=1076588 RepID=A0A7U6GJK5_9GAMM|nr:tRNA pseudouridine(13) synthase TruD [Thiolapillus brandeum]BAO44807.1 tRNA pseudouridine synthase D [Thiolapillus brandeum]